VLVSGIMIAQAESNSWSELLTSVGNAGNPDSIRQRTFRSKRAILLRIVARYVKPLDWSENGESCP
jgi:hypothetical protein